MSTYEPFVLESLGPRGPGDIRYLAAKWLVYKFGDPRARFFLGQKISLVI